MDANNLNQRPTLQTSRLVLRPFLPSDGERVELLAGHPYVAATTATIPHPYPLGAANAWISLHEQWYRQGVGVQFAIELKQSGELIGCIDLFGINRIHSKAELGYWIGVPYWNSGYCSEAAIEIVRYGFEILGLNKVTSRHMTTNPASGRVMMKANLRREGTLRQDFRKNGVLVDIEVYGVLRDDISSQ
jgi:[ribosomal protein S5]-alanine N-acetyltransferase